MAKGFTTGQSAAASNPERINYQGKTAQGFTDFAARASMEQLLALANEISVEAAKEINDATDQLIARRIQQHAASGQRYQNVAAHLVMGRDAESETRQRFNEAIDQHFESVGGDQDFFTKVLSGSTSTRLLGAA